MSCVDDLFDSPVAWSEESGAGSLSSQSCCEASFKKGQQIPGETGRGFVDDLFHDDRGVTGCGRHCTAGTPGAALPAPSLTNAGFIPAIPTSVTTLCASF